MNYKINDKIKVISGEHSGKSGIILGSFLDHNAQPFIAVKLQAGAVVEVEKSAIKKTL